MTAFYVILDIIRIIVLTQATNWWLCWIAVAFVVTVVEHVVDAVDFPGVVVVFSFVFVWCSVCFVVNVNVIVVYEVIVVVFVVILVLLLLLLSLLLSILLS